MRSERTDARGRLVLRGQIGLEAIVSLYEEAVRLATGGQGVDLDWQDAEYVTGGCLQVLLALGFALADSGQELRVIADNPRARRLVELTGLSAYLRNGVPA